MTQDKNTQANESPTLPEVAVKAPQATQDIDALVAALEKAGIRDAQELEGKMTAAREAGNLARLLGDARSRISALEVELQQSKKAPKNDNYDFDNMTPGEPVDIEDIVRRAFRKEVKEYQEQQVVAQRNVQETWQKIQNHPDYGKVKDIWETNLKDPTFVYQLQSGALNPYDAYRSIVDDYKDNLLRESYKALKQLREGKQITVPHVESGGATAVNAERTVPKDDEFLTGLKKRINKGGRLSQDEELAALEALLRG